MSVRLRLALTVMLTGLVTAVAVLVTVAVTFYRFERESSYLRAEAFLSRVLQQHDNLLDEQQRNSEEFAGFLRSLLLFDPDSRLYLLDAQGRLLASNSANAPALGSTLPLDTVLRAAEVAGRGIPPDGAYMMGLDPDTGDYGAVVAARGLARSSIGPTAATQGYLYLACRKQGLPAQRLAMFGSTLVGPALATVAALIVLSAGLAAWIIVAVTRPLHALSEDVARAEREGFTVAHAAAAPIPVPGSDEFARLRSGFQALLVKLHQQWDELKRLDHFRRESVSNLSHDLRSPLTATVACLETLERRWTEEAPDNDQAIDRNLRHQDRQLVAVALRNTRNAAGLVRSLGDLALLDEPQFKLHRMKLDLGEVLDDITRRFEQRAAHNGVALHFGQQGPDAPVAEVDIELFERAVANLLDNALKFTPAGRAIHLRVQRAPAAGQGPAQVQVEVQDEGPGIAAADLPHLFDRLYQSHSGGAPASSEKGKGLGLAIVKRIAELHQGSLSVQCPPGGGTVATLALPADQL
jgi:signal transduction histidine kinase